MTSPQDLRKILPATASGRSAVFAAMLANSPGQRNRKPGVTRSACGNFAKIGDKAHDQRTKKIPVAGDFCVSHSVEDYMRAIIASPKAEHDTSVAPSIRRAKS
jgi:hypothetical protein